MGGIYKRKRFQSSISKMEDSVKKKVKLYTHGSERGSSMGSCVKEKESNIRWLSVTIFKTSQK